MEKEIYAGTGGAIVNEAPPMPQYLKKPKSPRFKVPYPKPIAIVQNDIYDTKAKIFGLELNKQMASLASQELNLKSQKVDEIFPIVD